MKILALITPAAGAAREHMTTILPDEVRHTWHAYKQGFVREMYLMGEGRPGAVLVVEAESAADARRELSSLPLLVSGLAEVDCIALQPFTSIELLFAKPTAS